MKVLVVEDEAVVARRLQRMIETHLGAKANVTHAPSLQEAKCWLSNQTPDILMLDLNLSGQDGFDLLAEAMAGPQHTIVVSANTDRAMDAFEYGVLDFVGKPFSQERVGRALDRFALNDHPAREHVRFLSVRGRQGVELIPVEQLRAIHGAGDYAELELTNQRRLLHDKPLARLAQILPSSFFRIHRSHIIRLSDVRLLQSLPGSRYQVELQSGSTYPVGRQRVKSLRARLK